jgi:hypothetical protein
MVQKWNQTPHTQTGNEKMARLKGAGGDTPKNTFIHAILARSQRLTMTQEK